MYKYNYVCINNFCCLQGSPYNVTIDGVTQYFTGDTLELNCSSSGSPELLYSWSRNTSSSQYLLSINTTSSSITIANLTVDDEGVYYCTVSNEGGRSSHTVLVTIIGKNLNSQCIYC